MSQTLTYTRPLTPAGLEALSDALLAAFPAMAGVEDDGDVKFRLESDGSTVTVTVPDGADADAVAAVVEAAVDPPTPAQAAALACAAAVEAADTLDGVKAALAAWLTGPTW